MTGHQAVESTMFGSCFTLNKTNKKGEEVGRREEPEVCQGSHATSSYCMRSARQLAFLSVRRQPRNKFFITPVSLRDIETLFRVKVKKYSAVFSSSKQLLKNMLANELPSASVRLLQ